MKAVKLYNWHAWFTVETKHGQRLEFVLGYAEERRGLGYLSFTSDLWDKLKLALTDNACAIDEHESYGDIMYRISGDTPEEITNAIDLCEPVVAAWIKEYRINHMKDKR